MIQYSYFLTPAEQLQAQICAKKQNCGVSLWGGFSDAERKIAAFCTERTVLDWPVSAVSFSWNERFGSLGHRELLGSLMSLGFDRERTGDILAMQGNAYVIVHRDIAEYIANAVRLVGRIAVSGSVIAELPVAFAPGGEELCLVVSSLRLDALISAVWKMPRSQAREIVASGRARVDYCQELRPDRMIQENTLVSVRGMGRFILKDTAGKTKKDKMRVLLMRF